MFLVVNQTLVLDDIRYQSEVTMPESVVVPRAIIQAFQGRRFSGSEGACALFEKWLTEKRTPLSVADHARALRLYVAAWGCARIQSRRTSWLRGLVWSWRAGSYQGRAVFSADCLRSRVLELSLRDHIRVIRVFQAVQFNGPASEAAADLAKRTA